jgi:hypothetical protein
VHPRQQRSSLPTGVRSRSRRVAARVSTVVALASCAVVASPAFAFADGIDVNQVSPAKPLGAVNSILIFAVAPIGILLVIWGFFFRPGSSQGSQRYRPARGWHAEPEWLGVPAREHHSEHALEGADALEAEAEGLTGRSAGELEAEGPADLASRRQGGAHGNW